jgi:hypothetical protein
MIRSPGHAGRALDLAADLIESFHRQWAKYHAQVKADQSYYPASTLHGGGRSSGVSDPVGERVVHPDPHQLDLHQTYADLHQSVQLFASVDEAQCRILGGDPITCPRLPTSLRYPPHATTALDLAGYLVERIHARWAGFHRALAAWPLDLGEAYADLDHALALFANIHQAICKAIGGDPVRLHCGNTSPAGCPDRSPPALGRHRCWACDAWRRRHGEERTRAAEARVDAAAPQNAPEALPAPDVGVGEGEPAEALTEGAA